jgi:hypothetical protein
MCGEVRNFLAHQWVITHKARQKHDDTATYKGSQIHPVKSIKPFQILDAVFAPTSTHVTECTQTIWNIGIWCCRRHLFILPLNGQK